MGAGSNRPTWPRGSSRTGCPSGCSCSSTSTSGCRPPAAYDDDHRTGHPAAQWRARLLSPLVQSPATRGWLLYALTVRYGQTHLHEIEAARRAARALAAVGARRDRSGPARHRAIGTDRRRPGATGSRRSPRGARHSEHVRPGAQHDLPVPRARLGRDRRRLGHRHRRQRPRLLGLSRLPAGVHRGVRADGAPGDGGGRGRDAPCGIHAPLQHSSKADIIRRGTGARSRLRHHPIPPRAPRVDGRPCGRCDSCQLRARGFAEVGVADPALHVSR